MSAVAPEKKKRTLKKTKVVEPAPEPISTKAQVVQPEPVPEPSPVPEPVPELPELEISVEHESESDSKDEKSQKRKAHYNELKEDLEELHNKILEDIIAAKALKNKELIASLKVYDKLIKKVKTNIKKVEPKEKRTVVRSQPSGFNKPLTITQEIADFGGWDASEKKSRTDVTILLCEYVKQNGLQKEENKRIIVPDEKLAKVLRYDARAEPPLSYSTMQKYIGHLFVAA